MNNFNCIVVLGPTASGKTKLACSLAYHLNGEVISADSRQVYKYLNIGTGKDLQEFNVNGKNIRYHLIDICEPGEQFYLHQFAENCENAFNEIVSKNKLPIVCGGTGLYLDALRKDFTYTRIKENAALREKLEGFSNDELVILLDKFDTELTEHVDRNSRKRLIRGIEIAEFRLAHPGQIVAKEILYRPCYIGIDVNTEERKKLIAGRLIERVNSGLIDEAESLLKNGISHERLVFLGLEYKFVSFYLQNKISKAELIQQLQTAIFQYAKRQMTWFRKMEKDGVKINWIKKDKLALNKVLGLWQS